MGKASRYGNALYNGQRSIDFVGHRRLWYAISLLLVALALVSIFGKGLNFGIEFTGGTQYKVPLASSDVTQDTADELREAIAEAEVEGAESPVVTTAGSESVSIQVGELDQERTNEILDVISETVEPTGDISTDEIGASWGEEVAERALLGVAVFLVLVMIFIWIYFREWKMSIAAMVALFHDIVITVGIYALSGFPVTPSAVTGLLAVLGFSLYDTVVVFDKVRENTHELRKPGQTYADAANLAVNQTLVRSINTGIVALIPIGAILWVSVVQLGGGSLQDLALSQFVGMAVGIYSSVLLAPRILVQLKGREAGVQFEDRRAKARAKRASVDPYANVPAFTEDMPVADEPGDSDELDDLEEPDGERPAPVGRVTAPPRAEEATGRGRVAPPAKGSLSERNAAGRTQPTRQPRSKRGRK
ncbi:protein translocase subunit SecF [Nocardioides pantholopis]|uniref:protein translocase subunit SecF n=1 Tax=Nocardioides pantholopis TaxID=2483798 RepID=UPI000F097C85|nr:protein translocase subunit SecF [Nocardioides pantholopis]